MCSLSLRLNANEEFSDNSTSEITKCATVRCSSGAECQVLERNCTTPPCETYASCVNVTVVDSLAGGCATMLCGPGEICKEAMVKCAAAPCPKHAMCVRDMTQNDTLNSCASDTCPVGESCEVTTVQCFVPPCPKTISCNPHPTTQTTSNTTDTTTVFCDKVTCPDGDQCDTEWFQGHPSLYCRDSYNRTTLAKCDRVTCPDGEYCFNVGELKKYNYRMKCVPKPPRTPARCKNIVCPNGEECMETYMQGVVRYKCESSTNDHSTEIDTCERVNCPKGEKCDVDENHYYQVDCVDDPDAVDNNPVGQGSCAAVTCSIGESCVEQEVMCFAAPCPKRAFCVSLPTPPVPANQTYLTCKNITCATDEQCEDRNTTLFCSSDRTAYRATCDQAICPDGKACQQVNIGCEDDQPCQAKALTCVDKVNASICSRVKCPKGEICQETRMDCGEPPCDPWVSCIKDPNYTRPTITCDNIRCPGNEICEETTKCDEESCRPWINCVPKVAENPVENDSGCAAVSCPVGERCVKEEVPCFVAPCPKAVSCVPMNTSQNSTARQGCDVVRCRVDEICQETVVQCITAPCPLQVACVSIVHVNGTTGSTNGMATGAPPSTCSRNQTMSECLNTCSEAKCPGGGTSMMCTKRCSQGCVCATGFVRSSDGECYKSEDCPPDQICGQNEEYLCEKCAGTCKNPSPNCPGPKNKNCQKKCICAAGFVKKNGKCVTLASCPDHDHSNIICLGTQEYTDCLPKCRQLCSGVQECDTDMPTEMCTPGCVCRANYKMDSNGDCVHNRHCFKTTNCPLNEEWSKCVSDDNICNMATIQRFPLRDHCFSGCICSTGFARNSNGTCVKQDKC